MRILVTGAAGFIGAALSQRLLARGDEVVGVDNFNDYYDPALKEARAATLTSHAAFRMERLDIADRSAMEQLFQKGRFERVAHLAAQAGVRYSVTHPHKYVDSNLVGFGNVLEGCRQGGVKHLVYASSSSVYGLNAKMPFSEHDNVDHPVSLYAATKKANELMAHTYAHLFDLPCTGLRFFTVYGPWGRPDMSPFLFAKAMLAGEPIKVFNHGDMQRDFTYIDDIVEGVVRCLDAPPARGGQPHDPAQSSAPWRIFNIGNNEPVALMRYIEVFEQCLGLKARLEFLPLQPGDVVATAADIRLLDQAVGFKPKTTVEEGVRRFLSWYKGFYKA
ncbi:MAG TPA: NAD-dependent epimerase [Burkholderiales bacterium]|nr:NAD-dependent epimerase [Burkholderiales bacterium]